MATDIEKLVVQLSADFKSFERSLARANDVSNRQFNAIERRARQMNKNLDSVFSKSFSGLTAPLAGVGAALGVDQLRKMTDTWTDLTSRVNLATGSIEKGTEVMGRLGDMARVTYSDLSQTTESYLSNSTALKELGYSADQTLDYTEALNNALVVSSAKGDRAARVIDALAKAMALGKLSGDNLNTVIASGGRVAEALAAGLNTTVGGLRKLGAQGKITGNDVVKALSSQMETLRKEAESMPATIGDGFTLLNNALLQYVGNADSATGVSRKISDALVIIADNFDKVADAGLQVAAVLAGALVGRSLANMIRTLGLAGTALSSFTKALAAARTIGGLATALGGLSSAAGPLGLLIGGALVLSLGGYAKASSDAANRSKELESGLEKIGLLAPKAAKGLDETAESASNFLNGDIARKAKALADEIDRIRNGGAIFAQGDELGAISDRALSTLRSIYGQLNTTAVDKDARREIASLAEQYRGLDVSAKTVFDRLNAIRNLPVSESVKELADELERSVQKISGFQAQAVALGDMPELDAAKQKVADLVDQLQTLQDQEAISPEQRRQIEALVGNLLETEDGAKDAARAIEAMGRANPNLAGFLSTLSTAISKLGELIDQSRIAADAIANVTGQGSSSFSRGGRVRARQELLEERRVTQEYVDNAKKRASLSKAQYDLETKIAQVKAQAEKDGRKLTDAQIREIAAAQVAGDNARTAEGKKPKAAKAPKKTEDDYFFQITQQVKDRTAALAEEAKITGLTYVEQEKRRTALELEQDVLSRLREEARKKGDKDWERIKLSSDQVAKIDAVSEAYARQADELRKVQEAQGNAEQAASEFYDTLKSGMVGAITGANSLQDALKGILNRLADMLLNSAFDKIFGGASAVSSGSWLTGIMKSIGFADGGYTGNGDKYQPAGVVHKGEYVFDKDAVKKAGGPAALDAMRRGLKGYANGGYVGNAIPRAPSMPILRSSSATQQAQSGIADVRVFVDRDGNWQAEVERIAQRNVKQGLVSYDKSGAVRTARDLRQVNTRGLAK